jgi:thioredoxin-dependent peroxiredoxin
MPDLHRVYVAGSCPWILRWMQDFCFPRPEKHYQQSRRTNMCWWFMQTLILHFKFLPMLLTLTTTDSQETQISFDDLLKQCKYTLIYFYPKDDTPGCTVEAQGFNALAEDFWKYDTQIIGVSKDPHTSHCKFLQKYWLSFPLIADTDLLLHNDERFQTWIEKSMYGKTYMGSNRQTFLLDGDGNVLKKWEKVDTKVHAGEVLELVKSL